MTVSEAIAENAFVTTFRLVADDALPAYRPGQSVTIKVTGAGDPVPVRTYSLSGDPGGGDYRISVKRDAMGTVSRYLHERLRPGDRIEVAAPRGEIRARRRPTNPVLLISAGIGLTPVLAMLRRLASEASTRDVWWIHTTHDAASHAFSPEVTGLLGRLASPHMRIYYTTPTEPPTPGSDLRAGRLTAEVVAGLDLPVDASAYVCGPESFMDDVTAALADVGVDPASIHTERFSSRGAINPGVVATDVPPPHQPPGPPGPGPAVTFARSGLTTAWSDAYASLLELAEACAVPTQWSMPHRRLPHLHDGSPLPCGGVRVHPPLEEPGDGELLICSAQPTADLVLDL